MTSKQYYYRLLAYITPCWKMLTLAIFSMALMAFTLSILPAFIQHLLDHTIVNKNQGLLQQILLATIILLVIRGAMYFISNYAVNSVCIKFAENLRIAMFKKFLTLPDHDYTTLTNNDVAERFMTDLNQLTHACIKVFTISVKDSLSLIGLFAWMFYINQELTLLALLVTALMIIIIQLINGSIDQATMACTRKTKYVINILNHVSNNYQTIKLHSSQSHEIDRFTSKLNQMQGAHQKHVSTQNLGVILTQIFFIIILSTAGYLAIQQAYNNATTLGEAGSFLLAILLLAIPLKQILSIKKYIKQGQQSLDNVFLFLDQETKVETGTITIKRALGGLVFDHVSFYQASQTQPLLKNITLTINPGEVVVLTNATKSVKSTLINLILQFCQPSYGKIRLDGHNLTNLKSTSIFTNIAFLSKNVPLIDDTVAANIAYGQTRCANEAKITSAAQASQAMAFIREMPQGLQTQLGEYGKKLSDKQQQHIGIARVLLKDAPILILDEIPAASENTHDILHTLIQNRTTLIFTQCPSIINLATRVINLENGYANEVKNSS